MFPGHFKIAGHSGTDFKNRKAFKRIKKLNKISAFKYGDQYGQQKFEVDKKRMLIVEKEKRRKLLMHCIGGFLFIFIIVMGASHFLNQPLLDLEPFILESKYEWKNHGSESVLQNIETRRDSLLKSKVVEIQE